MREAIPPKLRLNDITTLQVLIRQKEVELERLRTELEAAARVEAEQKEFIQRFNAA